MHIIDNRTLQEKSISESEAKLILNNMSYLSIIANEIDYYRLVKYNISSFVGLQKSIHTQTYDNFMILNSGLANWLNSYYMWLTFHNHKFKLFFPELISRYREEHIVIKLANALRNHETHDSFAITEIRYDVINETTSYYMHTNSIIEKCPDKANYKKWLINKLISGEIKESIDAIEFTLSFETVLESVQHEIWDLLVDNIVKSYNDCIGIIDFEYSHLYNLSICFSNEGEHDNYPFGQRLFNIQEKIRSNYHKTII